MKKRKFNRDDIIELLIKQASGYYYKEEQLEYEKTQNRSNLSKNLGKNIDLDKNFVKYDMGLIQTSFFDDTLASEDETRKKVNHNNENLTLSKKKVTTHFVSPDMQAIKLLLEIFSNKVDDENYSEMSDEELLALKNKLIGELTYETNKNIKTN